MPPLSRCFGHIVKLKYLQYYQHYRSEDHQKSEVESREKTDIAEGLALDVRGILAEGDEACERGNESSHTADVNTYQKLSPIFGKLGKQYCRGDVTDYLTGKHAREKRVLFKQEREKLVDSADPRYITRQKEESGKGEEKGIIDF